MKQFFLLALANILGFYNGLLQVQASTDVTNLLITAIVTLAGVVATIFFLWKANTSEMKKMMQAHAEKIEHLYENVIKDTNKTINENTSATKEGAKNIAANTEVLKEIGNTIRDFRNRLKD